VRHSLPTRDEIAADTPLRLAVAAEIAFPGSGTTASGLRREGARGRLVIERIAGRRRIFRSGIVADETLR
jgi:hypothetical protein